MTARLKLITALQEAADELERRGIQVNAWKRRDKREPERRAKEAAEDALMLFVRRHFRRQEKAIRERAAHIIPTIKTDPIPLDDIFAMDEDELAELIRLLTKNTKNGINLFKLMTGIDIDYTMTNQEAAEWARKYAATLISEIDKATLSTVRGALQMFVETPGFTIGDLMNLLPFDEERALRIAVTEVTRTYAQGQLMAGKEMKEQFPDVRVVKRWFTNMDDRVCELCGPLDGVEVEQDEEFYPYENEYQDGNPPRHVNCRCWLETSTALGET